MKYRANGRLVRESTGTTKLNEAKKTLARRMGAAAEGRPILPRADKVKIYQLAEDLVNDYKANQRPSLDRLEYSLKHLLPFFGECRAVQVTPADVNAYIAMRQAEGATNGTINRELGGLKRMYSLAVGSGKLHQAPKIPRLREDNVRTGFFEWEQFQAVHRNLPEYVKPVVTFAYITGWRLQSEVLPLILEAGGLQGWHGTARAWDNQEPRGTHLHHDPYAPGDTGAAESPHRGPTAGAGTDHSLGVSS